MSFFIINVISKGCVIFIWSINNIINIFDYEIELNIISFQWLSFFIK